MSRVVCLFACAKKPLLSNLHEIYPVIAKGACTPVTPSLSSTDPNEWSTNVKKAYNHALMNVHPDKVAAGDKMLAASIFQALQKSYQKFKKLAAE